MLLAWDNIDIRFINRVFSEKKVKLHLQRSSNVSALLYHTESPERDWSSYALLRNTVGCWDQSRDIGHEFVVKGRRNQKEIVK